MRATLYRADDRDGRVSLGRPVRHRAAVLAALGAAMPALAAGCGESNGGDDTEAGAEGTEVTATETDFEIELSETSFSPGTYTFVAENEGQTTHALEVEGQGMEEETADLEPGDSERLTVILEEGEYEIYCPVGDHEERGMKTTITVS